MQDSSYGPLNTTVRVQETNLLKQSDYDRMLSAKTYEDAVRVLADTGYREGIEEAIQTREYDDMLMDELKETYQWIMDQSPSPVLSELMTLSYAYHNIKVLFKEELTGKDFDQTLIDIGLYPIYEFRRAVSQGQSDVLPKWYMQNINNLRIEFAETPRLNDIDIFVDRAYVHHLKRLSEEIADHDVTRYIEKLIDNTNMSIFFRAMANDRGRTHLQATITNEGAISTDYFVEVAEGGMENAIRVFSDSPDYRDIVAEAMDDQGKFSLRRFEQAIDNATETYLQQARYLVFGPLPVLAFISAKEIEVKNIRLVLTGKINNIDSDIVRDRMRLDYAV